MMLKMLGGPVGGVYTLKILKMADFWLFGRCVPRPRAPRSRF